MSEITGAPAAMDDAGITQAEHDSAIAAARSEGEASGINAATDRFAAIVSADGIRGNAGRMAAAVDLAMKSPGMTTEDVVAFVTANVAGTASAASPASLAGRLSASADPLAASGQTSAAMADAGWARARDRANARFGKDGVVA